MARMKRFKSQLNKIKQQLRVYNGHRKLDQSFQKDIFKLSYLNVYKSIYLNIKAFSARSIYMNWILFYNETKYICDINFKTTFNFFFLKNGCACLFNFFLALSNQFLYFHFSSLKLNAQVSFSIYVLAGIRP